MSYASWLNANGYPGYSESFARKVYRRMQVTGENLIWAIQMVS